MTLIDLVFYGVALATIASAGFAVFTRNIVRAVFSLLATFFGMAVLYGLLSADFVAIIQVLVYVGGILVLLLFAVMLTGNIETAPVIAYREHELRHVDHEGYIDTSGRSVPAHVREAFLQDAIRAQRDLRQDTDLVWYL